MPGRRLLDHPFHLDESARWKPRERARRPSREGSSLQQRDICYTKIPKSAVKRELQEKGVQECQKEWEASTKGQLTKLFLPSVNGRLTKKLQMSKHVHHYHGSRETTIVFP